MNPVKQLEKLLAGITPPKWNIRFTRTSGISCKISILVKDQHWWEAQGEKKGMKRQEIKEDSENLVDGFII